MTVDTYIGIATVIGSTTAGIASIVAAFRTNNVQNKVTEVHDAVKTSNGHTIGEIIEANDLRREEEHPDPAPKTP